MEQRGSEAARGEIDGWWQMVLDGVGEEEWSRAPLYVPRCSGNIGS